MSVGLCGVGAAEVGYRLLEGACVAVSGRCLARKGSKALSQQEHCYVGKDSTARDSKGARELRASTCSSRLATVVPDAHPQIKRLSLFPLMSLCIGVFSRPY